MVEFLFDITAKENSAMTTDDDNEIATENNTNKNGVNFVSEPNTKTSYNDENQNQNQNSSEDDQPIPDYFNRPDDKNYLAYFVSILTISGILFAVFGSYRLTGQTFKFPGYSFTMNEIFDIFETDGLFNTESFLDSHIFTNRVPNHYYYLSKSTQYLNRYTIDTNKFKIYVNTKFDHFDELIGANQHYILIKNSENKEYRLMSNTQNFTELESTSTLFAAMSDRYLLTIDIRNKIKMTKLVGKNKGQFNIVEPENDGFKMDFRNQDYKIVKAVWSLNGRDVILHIARNRKSYLIDSGYMYPYKKNIDDDQNSDTSDPDLGSSFFLEIRNFTMYKFSETLTGKSCKLLDFYYHDQFPIKCQPNIYKLCHAKTGHSNLITPDKNCHKFMIFDNDLVSTEIIKWDNKNQIIKVFVSNDNHIYSLDLTLDELARYKVLKNRRSDKNFMINQSPVFGDNDDENENDYLPQHKMIQNIENLVGLVSVYNNFNDILFIKYDEECSRMFLGNLKPFTSNSHLRLRAIKTPHSKNLLHFKTDSVIDQENLRIKLFSHGRWNLDEVTCTDVNTNYYINDSSISCCLTWSQPNIPPSKYMYSIEAGKHKNKVEIRGNKTMESVSRRIDKDVYLKIDNFTSFVEYIDGEPIKILLPPYRNQLSPEEYWRSGSYRLIIKLIDSQLDKTKENIEYPILTKYENFEDKLVTSYTGAVIFYIKSEILERKARFIESLLTKLELTFKDYESAMQDIKEHQGTGKSSSSSSGKSTDSSIHLQKDRREGGFKGFMSTLIRKIFPYRYENHYFKNREIEIQNLVQKGQIHRHDVFKLNFWTKNIMFWGTSLKTTKMLIDSLQSINDQSNHVQCFLVEVDQKLESLESDYSSFTPEDEEEIFGTDPSIFQYSNGCVNRAKLYCKPGIRKKFFLQNF